jgi:hypothetical protein
MNANSVADTDAAAYRAGPAGELARWSALALLASLAVAAIVLGWRRLAGAFVSPPGWHSLLAAGVLLALMVCSARAAWRIQSRWLAPGPLDMAFPVASSFLVLWLALTLTIPGTSTVAIILFWCIVAVEEFLAWGPSAARKFPFRTSGPHDRRPVYRVDEPGTESPHASFGTIAEESPPAEDVTQQLTRGPTVDGGEIMTGWLRVPFVSGQRNATVHLAFCPPFQRTPRVSIRQTEGPTARIKTVQVLPFGARFDLKLSVQMDCALNVLLEFTAQSAPRVGPSGEPADDDRDA